MSTDSSSSETDVRRIQLGNTVFEGKNDVYVLHQGDWVALVDAGIALPETRVELESGLRSLGLALSDVDDVVLTHWHADHAGFAGAIQAESGATVHVHAADADLVSGDEAAWEAYHAREERRFEEWQLPDEPRRELRSFLDGHADARGEPVEVTPFEDGARLRVGGVALDVVHLPGHAAGLCGFAFDEERPEAFVGDAILPKYTPNVGGADLRVDSPLDAYTASLERIVDADWHRAWPGHRDPIDAPADRARTILEHHRERTRRVVAVLDDHGPCDVWTVSAHLFGALERIHILHGPGEAWAHLDHLCRAGAVERDGHRYRLVDSEVDVASLFPVL
ncbi:MBL fold metallo-hydrolase [Salinigranum halophilum]|jgi:glyoxylase-like metal-dependent hydrolase (beta-lactamase superfamily II)|uniref:MBL fold metallo-hydrolase n=1 Tax=Salinigranum halophilum TaxID=2565931 RepID=UPI0010A87E93|nr:MBL fold metallo-hydrolase [Salinigranum halophilum]